ncbi:MAG: hypothetical protein EXR45_07205 [Chloroflexi bacterium]|nr:hypothetical protein [Chloroflexota bacterium]
MFLEVTGVTPRAYAVSTRTAALKTGLGAVGKVRDAIHGERRISASQLYGDMPRGMGMLPATFVKGGKGVTIQSATAPSDLGTVLVGVTDRGICAILLGDDPSGLAHDLRQCFPAATIIVAQANLATAIAQVVSLIHEPATATTLPLDIRGTAFQRRVLHGLRELLPGETAAYSQLADRVGMPIATPAVANACGEKPIAVASLATEPYGVTAPLEATVGDWSERSRCSIVSEPSTQEGFAPQARGSHRFPAHGLRTERALEAPYPRASFGRLDRQW